MIARATALRARLFRLREAWGLRWLRRRLLLRAFRSRRSLQVVADRTASIARGDILLVATMRNEALRLPHFLDHYRRLGVGHFLIVDNDSTDATPALLRDQPDISVWHGAGSYRATRFGLDWTNALLCRYGHGHWTLTVDADEILVYPYWETRNLTALTGWLDQQDTPMLAAMMLDLYPKGPIDGVDYRPGQDPMAVLNWFDAGNSSIKMQPRTGSLWIQGGPRARHLLADDPKRAPTLNKIPLVKWHWRYAYLNSTHTLLPRRLNRSFADDGGELTSGLLLHTKFLPDIAARSEEELARQQHFARPDDYRDYHAAVAANPVLWCESSTRLTSWRQLEALGLMSRGGWL